MSDELIYTSMPTVKGVAILKLSADKKTREWIAEVDRKYVDVVFNAIVKMGSELPTQ